MPQMAPINWTTLIIFTNSIFLLFIINNYFCSSPSPASSLKSSHKSPINWKW